MHHFDYVEDELYCEQVPVQRIAKAVGTPFYLYSHATLKRHFLAIQDAFPDIEKLVCYSAKANTSQAILKLFADLRGGLDIVSGGELYRGLRAGFSADRIVYSGVGKRVDEIDDALDAGILQFNVESFQELDVINQRAGMKHTTAPVAIRVNPDVDPKTHPYISTGLKENKFGIDHRDAAAAYRHAAGLAHVKVVGIDCHIGSQITEVQPFRDALKNLLSLIGELGQAGIEIRNLDIGGGLGITYGDEQPPHPGEYAQAIMEVMEGSGLRLILEPGRVIVGNAGILVAAVLYRKGSENKDFVITDAGMNDLLRPSLYQAYHEIRPLVRRRRSEITADVVGPICESSDFLAQGRSLPDFRPGELLAVMSAGAYGFCMSSNYCSRPRVPEIMVKDDRFYIIRQRESVADLVRGESLPPFMK